MWETILGTLQNNSVMSVAFLTWAYVVFHFGRQITKELKVLTDKTRQMNYLLSNRLTKIEAHLEHETANFKPYRNGNS
jgi:hypothetical protein